MEADQDTAVGGPDAVAVCGEPEARTGVSVLVFVPAWRTGSLLSPRRTKGVHAKLRCPVFCKVQLSGPAVLEARSCQ
jgi:hypothetical protein